MTAPAKAIDGRLDAPHVPTQQRPSGIDGQGTRYRSVLSGKRILVVLDNARDAEQVRPLIPGGPGVVVVVTSHACSPDSSPPSAPVSDTGLANRR